MTYDTASGGRVFLWWSESPVPGAVLSAQPQIAVPRFKFKGGRVELVRGSVRRRHGGCKGLNESFFFSIAVSELSAKIL